MAAYDVIVKRLDALRVVALSEDLTDHSQIGAAAGRLYPRLHAALRSNGVGFDGLSFAFYEDTDDEQRPFRMTVALPVPAGVTITSEGLTTVDMPAVERAATTVVRGAPDQFHEAFAALHEWAEQNGEQLTAFDREVYIDCDGPPETWVTELQTVLAPKR